MKFTARRRINPLTENKEAKYYARPSYNPEIIELNDLADDISDRSTVNSTDVKAVIEAFLQVIPTYMKRGNIVKVGDLGNFKISFSSEGKENPDELQSSDITNPKIIFTPSVEFKKKIEDVEITRS